MSIWMLSVYCYTVILTTVTATSVSVMYGNVTGNITTVTSRMLDVVRCYTVAFRIAQQYMYHSQ